MWLRSKTSHKRNAFTKFCCFVADDNNINASASFCILFFFEFFSFECRKHRFELLILVYLSWTMAPIEKMRLGSPYKFSIRMIHDLLCAEPSFWRLFFSSVCSNKHGPILFSLCSNRLLAKECINDNIDCSNFIPFKWFVWIYVGQPWTSETCKANPILLTRVSRRWSSGPLLQFGQWSKIFGSKYWIFPLKYAWFEQIWCCLLYHWRALQMNLAQAIWFNFRSILMQIRLFAFFFCFSLFIHLFICCCRCYVCSHISLELSFFSCISPAKHEINRLH